MADTISTHPEPPHAREEPVKSSLVIVELDEMQSPVAVKRLRQGKGRLFRHIESVVHDLSADGTLKAGAQPVVIVVQQTPPSPWGFGED